jgi:hypothetical protein
MRQAFRMTPAVSLAATFFLSPTCYTRDKTSGCAIGRMPCWRGSEFKLTPLRNDFSFYLCMCLVLSSTHARSSKGEIWPEILSKPNFSTDAVHILYIIRSNIFRKIYKFYFFFNRERKSCPQFEWYGEVILAIPGNFPMLLIRTLITAT